MNQEKQADFLLFPYQYFQDHFCKTLPQVLANSSVLSFYEISQTTSLIVAPLPFFIMLQPHLLQYAAVHLQLSFVTKLIIKRINTLWLWSTTTVLKKRDIVFWNISHHQHFDFTFIWFNFKLKINADSQHSHLRAAKFFFNQKKA